MGVCDICGAPGMGTLISAEQMREAVFRKGFNPVQHGLIVDPMAKLHGGEEWYKGWKETIVAQDTSDWNICAKCMSTLNPYLKGAPKPTGVTQATVSAAPEVSARAGAAAERKYKREEKLTTQPFEPEEPSKGSLWRLQGIFFEPSKTFEDIRRKPGFVVPLILTIVITFAAWFAIGYFADLEEVFAAQIRAAPQAEGAPPEAIEMQARISALMVKYGSPVILVVMILLVTGVLLLMVYLSGGETTFSKALSVVAHVFFFQTLVNSALLVLVYAMASDPLAISLENPISSNLGPLFDQKESPALYRVASSFDLIIWYVIYLFGLGLSKVSTGIKVGKGVFLAAIPYALYVGIRVIVSLVFG